MADLLSNFKKIIIALLMLFMAQNLAFCGELFDEYMKSKGAIGQGKYELYNEYKNNLTNSELTKYDDVFKEKNLPKSVSAFIHFVEKGDYETVKLYLDAGINPNESYYASFPLFHAVKKNHYEIAKLLLERGANPNLGHESCLYEAIRRKNAKMFKLLLDYGSRTDYVDYITDKTLLQKALEMNQKEIVQMLLNSGVKIDFKSKILLEKRNMYFNF